MCENGDYGASINKGRDDLPVELDGDFTWAGTAERRRISQMIGGPTSMVRLD